VFSFLVGFGAAFYVLTNGPATRRMIARAVLDGYDAAQVALQKAHRASLEIKEDFEDAFAEVRAERAAAATASSQYDVTLQTLREMRDEIAGIRSELPNA
jgi:hypothetical protein